MKRNICKLPNGDMQLGGYAIRKDKKGLNLAWIITKHCVLNCPYCIGWKSPKSMPTLIDKAGGVNRLVNKIKRFRDINKKKLYITISGGEPTLVKDLPVLINALNKNNIMVELHTNLTTSKFINFLPAVQPSKMGQVMATYHGWKLDHNNKAQQLYMSNFKKGWDAGLTMVLKTIVTPAEIFTFEKKIERLKKLLPEGAPILPWVSIRGRPRSPTNANGAYPQAYTKEEGKILDRITQYRYTEQKLYRLGGGFFKNMPCAAGSAYAYMDIDGNIFPCYGLNKLNFSFGNILEQAVKLNDGLVNCPIPYCGTPFWGLWYGKNPWKYVPNAVRKNSYYNRFGPY